MGHRNERGVAMELMNRYSEVSQALDWKGIGKS